MTHILKNCQHVGMAVGSHDWISGSLDLLRRAEQTTVSVKCLSGHRSLFEHVLGEIQSTIVNSTSGHEAFHTLLQEIAYDMPSDSQIRPSERLHTLKFTAGTTHDIFYQQVFDLLDEIRSVEGSIAEVETSYAMDRVRDHISNQFPTKVHHVFSLERIVPLIFHAHQSPSSKTSSKFPFHRVLKQDPPSQLSHNLLRPPTPLWPRPPTSHLPSPSVTVTGKKRSLLEIMIDR